METNVIGKIPNNISITETRIRYCLYARKSTESDEQQALSIDSQIKEMSAIADRLKLNVINIKRESHSAKESGQRPVFKELLEEVRKGMYNGILTWAPDRLSRNAGDLGSVVDLMDQKRLVHNWGHPEMVKLRAYLQSMIRWLEHDWRAKRAKLREDHITEKTGINTGDWFSKLPEGIRGNAEAIVKALVKDSELPEEVGVQAVRNFHALVPEYPRYHWRQLHSEIKDASRTYYEAGDYYHAFIEASKRYVNAVRTKAVITAGDERADMQKVFPASNPMLSVTEGFVKRDGTAFTADTLLNIRTAHQMFSEGIICGGRHPISHEEIVELRESRLFTEDDCLDVLSLLSHLFSRLEDSTKLR